MFHLRAAQRLLSTHPLGRPQATPAGLNNSPSRRFLLLWLIAINLMMGGLAACRDIDIELPAPQEKLPTPEASLATPSEAPPVEPPMLIPSPTPMEPLATPTISPSLEGLVTAAEQAMYEGDYPQAILLWEQVIAQASDSDKARWVLSLARAYLAEKRYDLAIAQLSWVIAAEGPQSPLRVEALGLLGVANEAIGKWEAAITAYREYLALKNDAAPYVLWHIALAYKAMDNVVEQIKALESIDTSRLDPAFRAEVLSELALAYRRNRDPHSALRVYDEILSFAKIPDYRALILYYKGETLREAGNDVDAVEAFYRVAVEQPTTFAAFLALEELAGLPEPPPTPTLTATETQVTGAGAEERHLVMTDLLRGKIYYYAQDYAKALEYLDYVVQKKPSLGLAEAHYYLGLTLTKQGQYEDAFAHYDKAIELAGDQELLANAWFEKAWAVGASGSDPAGIYYEFYVNHPLHPRAPEAIWKAAQAKEQAGDWAQAAQYYATLAQEYATSDKAPEAAFRQGLAAYAQGDPYTASNLWRKQLENTHAPAQQARLLTWMGLAAKMAGYTDQADILWKEAVRVAPESYYGLRARDLLKRMPPRLPSWSDLGEMPSFPPTDAEWQGLREWAATWSNVEPRLDLAGDARLREVAALEQLGWHAEALQALQPLHQELKDSPLDLLALAKITAEWRIYPSTIWCAQRVLRLAREAGVATFPETLLRLVYPIPYGRLINQNAQRYDLDPLLLLALVRQESLFNPWARSSAGALGLAQIMPSTGEWIASRLQEEYRQELLLRPVVSLRYGAWFLDLLLGLYDRDWIAALVAYNAGPGNLRNWTGGQPIEDHDLFYETIPSQQARDYVTYIYEHYHWYERLYRSLAPSP